MTRHTRCSFELMNRVAQVRYSIIHSMSQPLRVIVFAGSDSSGCAGLQTDLRTLQSLRIHGLSVATAITAQTASAVTALEAVSPATITAQFRAAVEVGFAAGKTGLLVGWEVIQLIAELWEAKPDVPLVVDPLLASSSGRRFLDSKARKVLIARLLPLASVVTPNVPEAEWMVERRLEGHGELEAAAREIQAWGVPTVVIKGGHGPAQNLVHDLVVTPETAHWFSDTRLDTRNSRGTGCMLSTAIAAFLAFGLDPVSAVRRARDIVRTGLGSGYSLNTQPGPAGGWPEVQSET